MSNKFLLFVSDNGKNFSIHALTEACKRERIEVESVAITDDNLMDYITSSYGVCVVDSYENSYVLNSIKNKCYDLKKKIILYGNPEEVDAMKRIFTDSIIFKEFIRPVEIAEVIAQIKRLKEKALSQSEMKKILVVDDNGTMLRTINGWLEGLYNVSLANSAKRALDAIQKEIPDLILLDYEMPLCSGAKFMEMLSTDDKTKDIPIIFLTSRNDSETVNEVMRLRPKGYILKSTPQESLLKKIEDYFFSIN